MIRTATEADASAIRGLLSPDMQDVWPVDYLAGIIADDEHIVAVAEDDRGVIAFCVMHRRRGEANTLDHTFCLPRDMGRVMNASLVEFQVDQSVALGWTTDEPEWVYGSDTPELDEYARIEFGAHRDGDLVRGTLRRADLERVKSGGRLTPEERRALGR
jgi:hypothetical protein